MKTAKCPICGNEIKSREGVMPFKNRLAHKRCLKGIMKASEDVEPKPTVDNEAVLSIALPTTEAEYNDKKQLLSYIETLTGRKPTAKVYRLVEDYAKKYGFTFKGMLQGLQYYFEVLEQPVEGDCVGILPYIYEDAVMYMNDYEGAMVANASIKPQQLNDLYPTIRVQVKQKTSVPDLIDISKL